VVHPKGRWPVVCFDETPRQLIGEARVPVPAEPGKPARKDDGLVGMNFLSDFNYDVRSAEQRILVERIVP
jgi:hypothetical protein